MTRYSKYYTNENTYMQINIEFTYKNSVNTLFSKILEFSSSYLMLRTIKNHFVLLL